MRDLDFSLGLIGAFGELRAGNWQSMFFKKNYASCCGEAILEIGGEPVVYYNSSEKRWCWLDLGDREKGG